MQLFRSLGEEQQRTVAAFMEFLHSRVDKASIPKPTEPVAIPRPGQESVVKAIKRLRATYPMIDQNKLFNDTSQQMTEHLMHGKPAVDVINELEIIFSRHYQFYRAGLERPHEEE